jgi:excisionase family DNA binding protein
MAILQVSDQTIYRMIADKTIPFLTIRNSYRFDPKQIATMRGILGRQKPFMTDKLPMRRLLARATNILPVNP